MLLFDEFDSGDSNLPVRVANFEHYAVAIEVSIFSKFSLIP
jgi:hypothetical protein